MLNAYFDYLQPRKQFETDLVAGMVALPWCLRRAWRHQTSMIGIEMHTEAPDLERKFEQYDEDMRGADAFTTRTGKSTGLRDGIHFDIHLCRTCRGMLQQLRRLRQSENEPTEPPKTRLNGKK